MYIPDETLHIAYAGNSSFLIRLFESIHGLAPNITSLETLLTGEDSNMNSTINVLWVLTEPKVEIGLLSHFPNLKVVITATTGLTHLDLDLLKALDISVISLRDVPNRMLEISSSAEHAWLLVLATWRRFIQFSTDSPFINLPTVRYKYRFNQISGKTLGIVGMGRIGKQVQKYAEAFGMNTIFYDPCVTLASNSSVRKCESIMELVAQSEVVLLSASKVSEDVILTRSVLSNFKPGAILVNISRGSLLDEKALIEMVEGGDIAGIGCDVFGFEEAGNSAVTKKRWEQFYKSGNNVVLTPHVGGAAEDAITSVHTFLIEKFVFSNLDKWRIQ